MPFVEVNNIKLYYEDHGEGLPLILISGFGSDHAAWNAILPYLPQRYRVILFDNRGAGRSSAPDEFFDTKIMADDVAALMDHLQIEQACFCGHSMGTAVLLSFALKYPKRIKKMVLCHAFPKINTLSKMVFDIVNRMIVSNIRADILSDFFIPWSYANATLSNLDNHPEVIERNNYFKTAEYPQTLTGFNGQLRALLFFDVSSEVSKIAVPTLLIAGDQDILTPLTDSQYLVEHIPQAVLEVIQDVAHMCIIENPKASSEIINNFLVE